MPASWQRNATSLPSKRKMTNYGAPPRPNSQRITSPSHYDSLPHNSNICRWGKLLSNLCTNCCKKGTQATLSMIQVRCRDFIDSKSLHHLFALASTNIKVQKSLTSQINKQSSNIPHHLISSKLITTSCAATKLLFPLHDNSFSMSLSVCVCFKLMHE